MRTIYTGDMTVIRVTVLSGGDTTLTLRWHGCAHSGVQWPVQRAARTDAECEIDVCVQKRTRSPAHGPRLEHGEAHLMRERHAQWSEHRVAGLAVHLCSGVHA